MSAQWNWDAIIAICNGTGVGMLSKRQREAVRALRETYEQVVKERDEARSKLKAFEGGYNGVCADLDAERAKSAKLLKALKLECCCTGERKEYEPYDYITCDACDAVAEYESTCTPTESKKLFDDETFYNLMQTYRHTPFIDQEAVTKAFNEVKDYVLELAGYTIKSGKGDE